MAKAEYSRTVCASLIEKIRGLGMYLPYHRTRYEPGDRLQYELMAAWPEHVCQATFEVERFVGGGFAGQVYRCRLLTLSGGAQDQRPAGLQEGGVYAVKILIPPARFATAFRNWIYGLAFQAPFSAQSLHSACRAGLLWPKVLRLAAREVFGSEDAIADAYASFYDAEFGAYGEVREWIEGRIWRLESDVQPHLRKDWQHVSPRETQSPEYVAKRQFMHRLTTMMRNMGARELARQYEWTTYKSQPNVLKRLGYDHDPSAGLCAVDFRAGLALLPFLPMSPGDVRLIVDGIRAGSWTQFDRSDYTKLRMYAAAHPNVFQGAEKMLDALEGHEAMYRRSMPDIFHQGGRLMADPALRKDVRSGLIAAYQATGTIDASFARLLQRSTWRFVGFYLLGGIPLLGRWVRWIWGNSVVQQHIGQMLRHLSYVRRSGQATAAALAIEWHRCGRIGEQHALFLPNHVPLFWLERCSLRILPPFLHRAISEPLWLWRLGRERIQYLQRFLRDAAFREAWLRDQIAQGQADGMLHSEDAARILADIDDPYIAKYLKSVGVHLAFLPVTQVVSVTVAGVLAAHVYLTHGDAGYAAAVFGGVLLLFQVVPISPGSICRGGYVVYCMVRDRSFRDYVIAAPLSFVKYIGYLAFPIQMATTYPALSQFMASRWAASTVHIVPVFGEKGAVLEHAVFDLFYNRTRMLGRWMQGRMQMVLTVWMVFCCLLGALLLWGVDPASLEAQRNIVNILILVVSVGLLPRCLFYPLLHTARK